MSLENNFDIYNIYIEDSEDGSKVITAGWTHQNCFSGVWKSVASALLF